MAIIFCDGFDYYVSADITKRWTGISSGVSTGSPYSRLPSGQGLVGTASASVVANSCCYRSFGVNYVSGVVGLAVMWPLGAAASKVVLQILDGTTEQISIRTNSSAVLTVTRNNNLLATGTTVISGGVWYYMELKFTIATGTGGTVQLKLNGAAEIASTGSLNTRNTTNTQWNGIGLGSMVTWFDDVYALDTTAGSNTDFLGPIRVVALYPAAAGNYSQWTPNGGTNMGSVSEMFQDGDGSFNHSNTANQIDTFAMQDVPNGSGSIYCVQAVDVARQDSGAARTMAPLLRISGSDYVGTTVGLSTSYQFLTQIYDLQPVGGTPAWDIATVNAMEVGYKLIS